MDAEEFSSVSDWNSRRIRLHWTVKDLLDRIHFGHHSISSAPFRVVPNDNNNGGVVHKIRNAFFRYFVTDAEEEEDDGSCKLRIVLTITSSLPGNNTFQLSVSASPVSVATKATFYLQGANEANLQTVKTTSFSLSWLQQYSALPGGHLNVVADVIVFFSPVERSGTEKMFSRALELVPGVVQDLRRLRNKKELTDCELVARGGSVSFPAHKSVLAARSKTFKVMFSHGCVVENQTGKVNIDDIEPEVLEIMLETMYDDRYDNISEHAAELLHAAEKYELKMLKLKCEESLSRNITVENVGEMLEMAGKYNAEMLKNVVLEFIRCNKNLAFVARE